MATTDTRTGFRLPWSSDSRSVADDSLADTERHPDGETSAESGDIDSTVQATESDTAAAPMSASEDALGDPTPAAQPAPRVGPPPVASARPAITSPRQPDRRPTRFLADLTRAMRVAAEGARETTLSQYEADAKAFVERIHADAAQAVTDLRRHADEDIAGVREWSKAEMARIREETERRISGRRATLELELEAHAARIEREVGRVQTRTTAFEEEMSGFFERLLQEEDPTAFAAMAANLPDPPSFDVVLREAEEAELAGLLAPSEAEAVAPPAAAEAAGPGSDAAAETASPNAEAATETATEAASPNSEAATESVRDVAEAHSDDPAAQTDDLAAAKRSTWNSRIAALGLTPDFAAAEAEAAVDAATAPDDGSEVSEGIEVIAEDILAQRLAGLVGGSPDVEQRAALMHRTTQVAVVGLVSVASIASFKRHLGHVPGVQSVGVSSGPDGEFVFAVSHVEGVDLGEVVAAFNGFRARVTSAGEGIVRVTAHDPESES